MKEPWERILKRVFVDGEVVRVMWNQKLARMKEGYPTDGDYKSGVVRMGRHLRRKDKRNVLLHELLHDLCERSGLSDGLSGPQEELVVTSLTPWLLDLLRDNPDLVDMLTEED